VRACVRVCVLQGKMKHFRLFLLSNLFKYQNTGHGGCSNFRTEMSAKFRRIFGISHGISKFVFTFFTISRGTPNDILPNPGWETLAPLSAAS
jgi:hypothetical protein